MADTPTLFDQRPHRETCPTCNGAGDIDPAELAELLDRPGVQPVVGPKTSRVAGTTPRKGSQRHAVLVALYDGPMTAFEVARLVGKSPNQTATRLGELHDDLFVAYLRDPETRQIAERPTTPGNTGMVHTITPLGARILHEIES